MAADWREVRLGDVAEFSSGGTPKSSVADYWDGDIPWISAASMKSIFLSDSDRTLTPQGLESGSRLATEGSVLLLVRGSELHKRIPIGVATRPVAFNQDVKALRARDGLRQDFLLYWLLGNERTLLGKVENTGIGAGKLDTEVLKNLRVLLPDLPEQRAISHIFGTLDDRIELNRRMNETLEGMARALFKSWFVDFDPVRAKMEGRWQPGETLPGLPAELYGHFPDVLVESEVGEVPEGWEVRPLADLVEAERGLSYKGKHLADGGLPMHNLNSILEGGGYKYDGIKYYTGEYRDRHEVSPGDLIVANTEQGHDRLLIGYAAVIPEQFGPEGIFSHHLYRVTARGDSHLNAIFLCHLLNGGPMQQVVSGFANGTTVNMLPPDALQLPRLVVPPKPLVARFTAIAESIQSRKEELVSESDLLAELRDTLLPRLISGEVRVPDVDRLAEVELQ